MDDPVMLRIYENNHLFFSTSSLVLNRRFKTIDDNDLSSMKKVRHEYNAVGVC